MNPKVEINLTNLIHNLELICKDTGNSWIVVKENAYGLGLNAVSETLYRNGVKKFIVIDIEEGVTLRNVLPPNSDAEICVLNGFYETQQIQECMNYDLIPVISIPEHVVEWIKTSGNKKFALFLETGLNRYSVRESELTQIARDLQGANLRLVLSHLACARNPNNKRNGEQKLIFDTLCNKIEKLAKIQEKSLGASDALFFLDKTYSYDSYRIGSALYGFNPDINKIANLRNIVSLRAPIIKTFRVNEGDYVGYGDDCVVKRDTQLAILNIGISHGLYRSMSNVGYFFIRKNKSFYKLPIVGRITMDFTTIDISDAPFLNRGDYVYLFDEDLGIAEQLDSLSFKDQMIRLNAAVPRPYHKEFCLNLFSSRCDVSYKG